VLVVVWQPTGAGQPTAAVDVWSAQKETVGASTQSFGSRRQ